MYDALADVTVGACRKLLLSVPPQHGKTTLVTTRYPVWRMLREPGLRVGLGAYNQTYANRLSRMARRAARDAGAVTGEKNAANEWELANGSDLYAVGVGAGITGRSIDLMVIDDPVKSREEADSEAHRERVWEWFLDDVTTRLQEGAAAVVIMTRWHMDDLAGRLLASDDGPNWRAVNLPALAEEGDPLGRAVGEPLCPERFTAETLHERQRVLGEAFWGLYQGRPVPRGGAFFRRDWFPPPVPAVPNGSTMRRVRYWDLAASRKDSACYTAGVLMAYNGSHYHVEHVVRGRWVPADRNEVIRKTADLDEHLPGYHCTWFEAAPGLGKEVSENLVRTMAGRRVRADEIGQASKEQRAEPLADACRAGLVRPVRGGWNAAWLDELASFPRGAFKDQVDSTAGAFNKLARGGLVIA